MAKKGTKCGSWFKAENVMFLEGQHARPDDWTALCHYDLCKFLSLPICLNHKCF